MLCSNKKRHLGVSLYALTMLPCYSVLCGHMFIISDCFFFKQIWLSEAGKDRWEWAVVVGKTWIICKNLGCEDASGC